MMKRLQPLMLLATLIVAGASLSLAQAPTPELGDLGSVKTGMWDTVSTWKTYSSNGLFDSVSVVPSSSKNVFITTGTTVTYQTSSKNCRNLVVQSGAVLQSDQVLPTSNIKYVKINGPTVWIDGQFGRDTADVLSLEMLYNNNTSVISGSGVINIARLRPNSSSTGDLGFVFNTDARFNYFGSTGTGGAGIYTTNGNGTSVTITVNPGVTVNFAPNCYIGTSSSASSNGNMNTTYNINGTINLPASSIVMANATGKTSAFHVGSTGTVNVGDKYTSWLAGGSVATTDIAAGGVMNITSGGSADFTEPTSKVTGEGTFALKAGATIKIGAPAGLDSANGPIQTAVALLDTGANYSYLGTGVQALGRMLPDSVNNLTIGAASIDTFAVAKKVKGVLQIDGLLVDNGGLTSAGTAVVNGTYQLNNTNGPIPAATWNTGSTCFVTGLVTTTTSGIPGGNQNFFNYKVDCPGLVGAQRLGFDGDTLRGNLTLHNTNDPTGTAVNYIALAPKSTNAVITLLGDLIIDSTAAGFSIGSGSTVVTQTLIVKGNVFSRGTLFLNGSGVTNKLFVSGDLTIDGTSTYALRGHSNVSYADSIVFCGPGVQKFIKPVANTSMVNIRYRVMPGSTLWLNDTITVPLGGATGVFSVDSGATLKLGHPGGVNGAITRGSDTLRILLNSGASYEFNGLSAQVTGSLFPTTVNTLTINDSLGVTLSSTDTVTGTLAFTKGTLSTDANTMSLGPAAALTRTAGYVIGNLQKQFAAPVSKPFEVGTANGFSPVNVNVTAGAGAMTVAAVQGQHDSTFDAAKTLARYWKLTADGTITGADLKFLYLASDVAGDESKYGAWRYTGTGKVWTPLTSVNNVAEHSVSAAGVTSFSDWTLGESNLATAVKPAEDSTIPETFFVQQNYPNPFNPTTRITYGLPNAAYVTARVYNLLGQEVVTLLAGQMNAGVHSLDFNASGLSSGVYLCRIQAGTSVDTKRMLLVK